MVVVLGSQPTLCPARLSDQGGKPIDPPRRGSPRAPANRPQKNRCDRGYNRRQAERFI